MKARVGSKDLKVEKVQVRERQEKGKRPASNSKNGQAQVKINRRLDCGFKTLKATVELAMRLHLPGHNSDVAQSQTFAKFLDVMPGKSSNGLC